MSGSTDSKDSLGNDHHKANRKHFSVIVQGRTREILKQKKMLFDEKIKEDDTILTLVGKVYSNSNYYGSRLPSKSSIDQEDYFCDWYPELFGIDEDEIPPSEDEEGQFDIDWDDTEDIFKSLNITDETAETIDQIKLSSLRYNFPKYGRRARQKPVLERENHEKFDCLCDIDFSYSRHYIPHFGGGMAKKGEELKTPHFRAFWEDFREQAEIEDSDRWSKIFESSPMEPEEEKGVFYRPTPKFPGSSKNDIKKFREQILASFRPLNCREVRRYRMPYAEALYLELQEDMYLESASFFKHLIIRDHFVHETPDSYGFCLRDSRLMMNRVVTFLKLGERFSRRKEYHKEALVLMRSGKYFNDHDKNWWWLAEEFYTKAVKVSQNSVLDGGKAEAISNYILGTFLLDCVHRVQPAQEHLLKARELSMGKEWSAKNILHKKQDTVYKECANYLCRALIAVSKELREQGKPEEALPLIRRSHKLCEESRTSRWDIEMETYFELGLTYEEVGYFDWAKTAFRKFIEIALVQNCYKNICDGYLELAICYRSEGDLDRCHRNLLNYLKIAEGKEDENLIAFGNRYLGEFYLNNGKSRLAAEHFKKAFYSFHQQCTNCLKIPYEEWQPERFTLVNDVELTRVLVGLAEGEVLTKPICHLILEAKDKRNQEKFLKLINWKNNREKIFEAEEVNYEENNDFMEENDLLETAAFAETEPESEHQKSMESQGESEEFRTVRFAL